jgi:hypothetical protein
MLTGGTSMKWTCHYEKLHLNRPKETERFQLGAIVVTRPKFPAVFFLDADIFQSARIELPKATSPIPQQVLDIVGDTTAIRTVAADYFDTVHLYMRIVSQKLFYEQLLNPLHTPSPHVVLLFLCMRLVMSLPQTSEETVTAEDAEPSTIPIYLIAKSFFAQLEAAGICSIQVLQAGILIALYELGHAIYPAAFLTVGACARYGTAFGFDGMGCVDTRKSSDWIEIEQTKRVWWAVLILDR